MTILTHKNNHNLAIALWNNGYTDKEIAEVFDMSYNGIQEWRRRERIPANHRQQHVILNKGRQITIDYKRVRELYDNGLNDVEIANEMGHCVGVINTWRRENRLKANSNVKCIESRKRNAKILAEYVPDDDDKPWRDPESLFCDTEFLRELIGKDIQKSGRCK